MRVLMLSSGLPAHGELTMAPAVRQIDSIEAAGVQVSRLPVVGFPKLKYVLTVPQLWRRAREVDLIHAHYGFCGWLAHTCRRTPVVVSFMGSDLLGSPDPTGRIPALSRLEARSSRRLAPKADGVIVKSAEMARALPGVSANVIPNGVDVVAFRPSDQRQARIQLGWPAEGHVVLFAGDPDNPRKAFPLAEAAVEWARRELGCHIRIVPLKGVRPDQVSTYMNASNLMLMTSFVEGSPNVVKEAMACNLPVASVPVGDVEDLLEGVAGYAICRREPAHLGEAVAKMLAEPASPEGRARLLERGLDLQSVAGRIISVYEHVLAASPTLRAGMA